MPVLLLVALLVLVIALWHLFFLKKIFIFSKKVVFLTDVIFSHANSTQCSDYSLKNTTIKLSQLSVVSLRGLIKGFERKTRTLTNSAVNVK